MRCYLVTVPGVKRYASTNADSVSTRNEFVEELGCKKKDVEIKQVDIPTSKPELLEFINNLCKQLDDIGEVPDGK